MDKDIIQIVLNCLLMIFLVTCLFICLLLFVYGCETFDDIALCQLVIYFLKTYTSRRWVILAGMQHTC